jgi:hypothetical protein
MRPFGKRGQWSAAFPRPLGEAGSSRRRRSLHFVSKGHIELCRFPAKLDSPRTDVRTKGGVVPG